MSNSDLNRTIAAVWRIESPRLIGMLARMLGDLSSAEEVAQDTFLDALRRWERDGIPEKPGAWLMTAGKHLAIDTLRRVRRVERSRNALADEALHDVVPQADADEGVIRDDVLRLVFVACHPALPHEARVALTLRFIGGLSVHELARAFLVPESTIAQRITRAKRTLVDKQVAFELPEKQDLLPRLESVLEAIYLIFNEGYTATVGDDWTRPELCNDALRLGRILAQLLPSQPEVHGLLSLMEVQASRLRARVGKGGKAVLLLDQDRTRWDLILIRRGLEALTRAEALIRGGLPGPYVLQAAIAACHARARTAAETDWIRIAALYEVLHQVAPSPIVELNRAVAVGMAFGAEAGLHIVDRLVAQSTLADYAPLPSVRADLLAKLGRYAEARLELDRAFSLNENARERELLRERAAAYEKASAPAAPP